MSKDGQTDKCLLEGIRKGKAEAWSQLIDQYQGRLSNFALARLGQCADAEDAVQDTFVSFLGALDKFRGEAGLETYLFTILRNKICDRYRTRTSRSVCLIQDVYNAETDTKSADALAQITSADPAASWYISQDEQHQLQRQALTAALRKLVNGFKETLKFRDLKIVESIFYSRISSKDATQLLSLNETTIRVCKHRCLRQIRENVAEYYASTDITFSNLENLLTEIWESQRLSCPKRSTLGAFLLETLEPEWFDYVDFHLTALGCHFCRANFKDLQHQQTTDEQRLFHKQIMASTVGFFSKS